MSENLQAISWIHEKKSVPAILLIYPTTGWVFCLLARLRREVASP